MRFGTTVGPESHLFTFGTEVVRVLASGKNRLTYFCGFERGSIDG